MKPRIHHFVDASLSLARSLGQLNPFDTSHDIHPRFYLSQTTCSLLSFGVKILLYICYVNSDLVSRTKWCRAQTKALLFINYEFRHLFVTSSILNQNSYFGWCGLIWLFSRQKSSICQKGARVCLRWGPALLMDRATLCHTQTVPQNICQNLTGYSFSYFEWKPKLSALFVLLFSVKNVA